MLVGGRGGGGRRCAGAARSSLLTGVLVAGAPGLVMDGYKSVQAPNGGAYANVALPQSRVDAARWVRDHSAPDDVVATNVALHRLSGVTLCDSRSFWLSAYAERSVLVEGWGFAPRQARSGPDAVLGSGEAAPQRRGVHRPHGGRAGGAAGRHGVRWLVVDRVGRTGVAALGTLADLRFDNGRLAVYRLWPLTFDGPCRSRKRREVS